MKVLYVDNKEDSNILMLGVYLDLFLFYVCEKSNYYFFDLMIEYIIYYLFYLKCFLYC